MDKNRSENIWIEEEWPGAILVGVCTTDAQLDADFVHSMQETAELIKACEMRVLTWVTQNLPSPHPGTYMGSGKLEELGELVLDSGAQYVVILDNLSPAQLKNISSAVEATVYDRTSLILEIFSRRAKTREARLQVELANLQYMLPRLVGMRQSLGRQGGASGAMSNKGSGEKQIELDRRRIEHRITELRRDLSEIEKNRDVQRKARERGHLPKASLVGYTNAGKSTLMNRLMEMSGQVEEKKVFEKDMLFATLDTTVRHVETGDKKDFLLSDTVGFISDLPHDLVNAFRSTLDEVRYADLLVLVVDASDEHHKEHLAVTEETLKQLGADGIPRIYVFNKVDKLMAFSGENEKIVSFFKPGQVVNENRIYISAGSGEGLKELLTLIRAHLYAGNRTLKLEIPYQAGSVLGELEKNSRILSREYTEKGTLVEAECPDWLAGAIEGNPLVKIL